MRVYVVIIVVIIIVVVSTVVLRVHIQYVRSLQLFGLASLLRVKVSLTGLGMLEGVYDALNTTRFHTMPTPESSVKGLVTQD